MIRRSLASFLLPLFLLSCGSDEEPSRGKGTPKPAAGLTPHAVLEWLGGDARRIAVDLRDPVAFAEGHLAKSVNLQAGWKQFSVRAERFFGKSARLCLLSSDKDEARRLATNKAGAFEEVAWLDADVLSLQKAGAAWSKQRTVSAKDVSARLDKGELMLLDARTAKEYAKGHAIGAVFLYPDDFPRQASFLRRDKEYVVVCEEGWRSSLLVSWLQREGFAKASNLIRGMKAWRAAGLPLEKGGDQVDFR